MPDLEDIRAFAEVVDSGSLTRAGARLGMSKSMISRRLARLEAELGAPLLARSTRGMSLTEAGSDFRPYAERMVAELQSARDARQPAGRGDRPAAARGADLVRQLAPGAGAGRAGGAAPAARDQHLLQRPAGRPGGRGVRRSDPARQPAPTSRLIARRIAAGPRGAGGEPGLSGAGRARRATPADLAGHEAIPHGDAVWQFRRDGKRFTHRPRGRFTADSGPAELAGVVAGLGIAVMPAFLAGPALERGELVRLLDDYEIPEAGLYVVRPPPAEPMPIKIKVLTDIMVEKFGGADWDVTGRPDPRQASTRGTTGCAGAAVQRGRMVAPDGPQARC